MIFESERNLLCSKIDTILDRKRWVELSEYGYISSSCSLIRVGNSDSKKMEIVITPSLNNYEFYLAKAHFMKPEAEQAQK